MARTKKPAANKGADKPAHKQAGKQVDKPKDKSLESWIWDAACSIRGAKDAPKNASQVFEKGDPKNFIPNERIQRIADTLIGWKEEEKLSRIVDHAELKKNDYNISPSRYIHTSDAETYPLLGDIVEELNALEAQAQETDAALRKILKQLGVSA